MENFNLCKDSGKASGANKIVWGCKESSYALLVLIIAALCFLPGLGDFGILDPTDSFFIEAAREMLQQNHYITALYNYVDWLDKPILSFLPIIISCKLFGMTSWAARLPAALSGIALVVEIYIFMVSYLGQRTAVLSAAILCSSPLFLLTGHVALSDETLSLFFCTAMLYIGSALTSKQKINIAAYVFLALAILTKGPVALILAFNATVFYLLTTCPSWKGASQKLGQLKPWIGVLIILAICLPYFYLAHATTGGAFTAQFFLRQNLGRMLGTVNHQEPIWFYLPVILGGYFPWILYLLMSIPWLKKVFAVRAQLTTRQAWVAYCCCWALSVLFLFTAVPTKLPTYIVPASPALAVIIAAYLEAIIRVSKLNSMRLYSAGLLSMPSLIVFASALISLYLLPAAIKEWLDHNSFEMSYYGLIVLLMTLAATSAWSFWHRNTTMAIFSLSIASILACAIIIPCSFRWVYQIRQVGINNLIHIAKLRNGNMAILFSRVPSAVFIMEESIPEIQSLTELKQFCQTGKKPHLLLATQNCLNLPELQAREHLISQNGKWYLLNVEGYPWQACPIQPRF